MILHGLLLLSVSSEDLAVPYCGLNVGLGGQCLFDDVNWTVQFDLLIFGAGLLRCDSWQMEKCHSAIKMG